MLKAGNLICFFLFVLAISNARSEAVIKTRDDLVSRVASMRYIFPDQRMYSAPTLNSDGQWHFRTAGEPLFGVDEGLTPKVIEISGKIEPGDGDRLFKFLSKEMSIENFAPTFLVFSGPGGNFAEALEITEVINEFSGAQDILIFGSVVLDGTECLSACAFALSLSEVPAVIEQGARVGFHLPYPSEKFAEFFSKQGLSLKAAFDVISDLSELFASDRYHPMFRSRVLEQREAKKFYYLHGDAESWKNGFNVVSNTFSSQIVPIVELDFYTAERICGMLNYGINRAIDNYDFAFFVSDLSIDERDRAAFAAVKDNFVERQFALATASGTAICMMTANAEHGVDFRLLEPATSVICTDKVVGSASASGENLGDGVTNAWCKVAPVNGELLTWGLLAGHPQKPRHWV